jgi:hypothetical protein
VLGHTSDNKSPTDPGIEAPVPAKGCSLSELKSKRPIERSAGYSLQRELLFLWPWDMFALYTRLCLMAFTA